MVFFFFFYRFKAVAMITNTIDPINEIPKYPVRRTNIKVPHDECL